MSFKQRNGGRNEPVSGLRWAGAATPSLLMTEVEKLVAMQEL